MGAVTNREFDLDWYQTLTEAGRERVERWLSRLPFEALVLIELTDDTGTTGNLTIVEGDPDDTENQILSLQVGVHWDDPFPEDAEKAP